MNYQPIPSHKIHPTITYADLGHSLHFGGLSSLVLSQVAYKYYNICDKLENNVFAILY